MIPYERYKSDLIKLGATDIMSEEEYVKAYPKEEREDSVLTVRLKKDDRPKTPTLERNREEVREKKPKAVKPPKEKKPEAVKSQKDPKPPRVKKEPYRPQKIYTDEEIKHRRKEARAKKRAENKAMGLTVDGKPRAQPKPPKSIEEIRAQRLKYAKTYRAKNREKHLAYRRACRKKKREEQYQSNMNTSSILFIEHTIKVA